MPSETEKYTPGPLFARKAKRGRVCRVENAAGRQVAYASGDQFMENATLYAAAPDHAILLAAICQGVARFDKWDSERGEVCFGGIRHAVHLDQFGCPILTDNIRAALSKSTPKKGDER